MLYKKQEILIFVSVLSDIVCFNLVCYFFVNMMGAPRNGRRVVVHRKPPPYTPPVRPLLSTKNLFV